MYQACERNVYVCPNIRAIWVCPNLITMLPEGKREGLKSARKLKGQQGRGAAWSSRALSSSKGKQSQRDVAEDPFRVQNLKGANFKWHGLSKLVKI